MANKPTTLPEWNSDDTNQTEPLTAKKEEGWLVEEDPSSAYFNWWMNLVWKWLVWLDDRVTNTGGAAPRIGLRGIGTIGEGGGTGITAVGNGAAAGVDAAGGATSGSAVKGLGGAPNGKGGEFTGDGTGSGAAATGGDASGPGLFGTGGAPNGPGAVGQGTGTGSGGEFTGGATGYGIIAQADTTTPVRAALRLVPQDTDPSSPQKGDVYANSVDGTLRWYDGSEWKTFSAVLPGAQVGYARSQTGAQVSNLATPAIPLDDTIPQSGEGSEMITLAYTPTKIGNVVRVRVKLMITTSAADVVTTALFKDATANAESAAAEDCDGGSSFMEANLDHEEVVASLAAVTWKVRVGAVSVRDIYLNGDGVRKFGGKANSLIEITEIEQ